MTRQRVNSRALAASRILENLAYVLPAYFDELLNTINTTVGYPDHTPGASVPTADEPTVILEGTCTGPVVCQAYGIGHIDIVDCGRPRPCPELDVHARLTPVEQAASIRTNARNAHADAEQALTTITWLANDLLATARRTTPIQPVPVPRCDATGLEGYLQPRSEGGWSDLACTNPRSRGTLCDSCSKRSYRWRAARGLKQLDDGVMANPAGTATDVAEYIRHGFRREA